MVNSAILALSLLPLAIAAPVKQPSNARVSYSPKRLPLTRRDGTINTPNFMRALNSTLAKYHAKTLPTLNIPGLEGILKARADVALTDQDEDGEDELYYGPGTIGATDPQTFTFDFDTGSSDIFVPGPQCNAAAGCPHATKYDQQGKSTGNTTSVTYGSGQVSGNNYLDDVTVGGLTSTNQGFISLTQAAGFNDSNADGLLGMGFSTIANSGFRTFFESLIAEDKVDTEEFSFYLGRAQSNTAQNSELTLGGRDTSKFSGEITQVPVTKEGYWQVALDSVKVGGTSAGPTTEGQAAIDTGTTLIVAPTDAALAIFALIPGSLPLPLIGGTTTLFAYPCDTTTVPTLTFAGKDFSVNPLDFNFGSADEVLQSIIPLDIPTGLCIAGIAAADLDPTQNLYIVGDTFLKSWYSIYNYVDNDGKPSVNFAKAV